MTASRPLQTSGATPPYVPENPLLPIIGEHTLVRTIGTSGVFPEATELDHLVASLWRLVHDLGGTRTHPLSVLEIASRSGLSRGTVILAVAELLRRHRIRVSRPHTAPRTPIEEVRDGLSSTHYDPALRSAKVLVLGTPEALARQFVGACSHTRPLAVQEMVVVTRDGSATPRPRPLLISMGTLPISSLHLCLLALPEPGVWDALWPSAVRDACGTILVTHPDHLGAADRSLMLLRRLESPVQVVLHHPDDTDPEPVSAAKGLGLSTDEMTLADVRSVPAARAALRDLVRQDSRRPHRVHLRTPFPPPNHASTNGRTEEGPQ
ncbi:hypothetical protein [Nocardiopsis alborubida]|uniref:Uncharacterized protein n=1 Tax=Nocardiopsis alborubida TaxID=146802 RepID=A0A7X6M8I3_9ACTN|nr:hypothetical protein [Nocardiopsis alborubida]NKY96648.1 hypothetical protein [Nocardiopsis alborubida]